MDVAFDILRALGVALAAGVLTALVPARRAADALSLIAGMALGFWIVSRSDSDGWWWAALIAGAAGGALASAASGGLVARVRQRLGDAGIGGVVVFAVLAAALIATGSLLFPPLALLAAALLGWLLVAGRRRDDAKYAGLRVLR
ncbi:MAG: hypothetical protein V9E83_08930 [Baekduia sp.]